MHRFNAVDFHLRKILESRWLVGCFTTSVFSSVWVGSLPFPGQPTSLENGWMDGWQIITTFPAGWEFPQEVVSFVREWTDPQNSRTIQVKDL